MALFYLARPPLAMFSLAGPQMALDLTVSGLDAQPSTWLAFRLTEEALSFKIEKPPVLKKWKNHRKTIDPDCSAKTIALMAMITNLQNMGSPQKKYGIRKAIV